MTQYKGLTSEERARVIEIQDSLIELYVEHKEALAAGMETRVKEIEGEMDDLLQEKAKVKEWAAV